MACSGKRPRSSTRRRKIMSLRSGSLQTPATDALGSPNPILDGDVTVMDVLDASENEKTSLLEVDDEFDVQLTWDLTGVATPVVGGVSPLTFQHTFHVAPPTPQVGLYGLTATINHSPTGNPNQLSEMFGFAESTPINI